MEDDTWGGYWRTRKDLEVWVQPKVEAWVHVIRTLAKIAKQYPMLAYAVLEISLQIEW